MDFLKDAALPQSLEHFHLIVLIAALNALVFVPYLTFVLGSSLLSYLFDRKGRKSSDEKYRKFSKLLIDLPLYSKTVVTFLGIIPGLALVLIYAQMLQSTGAMSVGLAGFGFLSLVIAFVLLYSYKYTFRLEGILENVNVDKANEEVEEYRRSNSSVHLRSGKWGLFFLIVAVFLYAAAMSITTNPSGWNDAGSFFDVVFSNDVWLKFLILLILSVGITGVSIIYFGIAYHGLKMEIDEKVKSLVHQTGKQLIVFSMIVLPLVILLNVIMLPLDVMSGMIYLLAGLTISFLFIAAHSYYGYFKEKKTSTIGYGMFMFLCAIALLIVNDYVVIANATKEHAAVLSARYDKVTEEMKTKLGITMVSMTGEDIYNAKCSACHLFNQKKVGPPYNETIPKYNGDKAKIIEFVMNPVKKNPAYPPMPSQGLKPAEADSIVSYIMSKVAGNSQQK